MTEEKADTAYDLDHVEELAGLVARREFDHAPTYAKAELWEWVQTLPALPDGALLGECRRWIHDDALVGRFRGNWEHIHFRCTAVFHESERRHREAGHCDHCSGSIYSRAHAAVMRSHGYTPSSAATCTCDNL